MSTATSVIWRRLRYALSPQFDIYSNLHKVLCFAPSVLEVGFATGFGTLQYSKCVSHVDAIEIDPGAVEFAKACMPAPNTTWILGDILSWRPPNQYGAAVMIEVLEHIDAWEPALRNVAAALLPEGFLVISQRNANAELRKNDLHEHEWTALELELNLRKFFRHVVLMDYTLDKQLESKYASDATHCSGQQANWAVTLSRQDREERNEGA